MSINQKVVKQNCVTTYPVKKGLSKGAIAGIVVAVAVVGGVVIFFVKRSKSKNGMDDEILNATMV